MLWAIIVLAMVMLFNMFQQPHTASQRVAYTDFLNQVDNGQLLSVTIQGHTLTGKTSDGKS
ncbi:MAG: ATP-dependent metallopeptidase FtsH/Yme1/Tma family protein, partial [Desulfovibrio sp.]|nr:ATP-dependent metallopeptidase FtsH/Yme1/Tma family protein [Desulfovibrio sp.]